MIDAVVVVFSGTNVEADPIRNLLGGAGIRSSLQDETLGRIAPYAVAPGGTGAVKVVIAGKDLDGARPIVDAYVRESAHRWAVGPRGTDPAREGTISILAAERSHPAVG